MAEALTSCLCAASTRGPCCEAIASRGAPSRISAHTCPSAGHPGAAQNLRPTQQGAEVIPFRHSEQAWGRAGQGSGNGSAWFLGEDLAPHEGACRFALTDLASARIPLNFHHTSNHAILARYSEVSLLEKVLGEALPVPRWVCAHLCPPRSWLGHSPRPNRERPDLTQALSPSFLLHGPLG